MFGVATAFWAWTKAMYSVGQLTSACVGHFRRPPDQLTPEHIREYQAYLFRERKLAASTVTQLLAAFAIIRTLSFAQARFEHQPNLFNLV
jgi:hypothetical protein